MDPDRARLNQVFERNYGRVALNTLLMKAQVRSIFDRLVDVRGLPGDAIEFGAYQGGLSFFLGLCIKDLGLAKRVFMLDSFEGLPQTDPGLDGPFERGTMVSDARVVGELRSRFGLDDIVDIRPGWFEDSVRDLPGDARFCLAHLDADVYRSTRVALEFLLPRLVEGGAVVLDDCVFPGATGVIRAADEVLGTDQHLHLGPKTQAFVFPKGDPRPQRPAPVWRSLGGRRYDLADLLARTDYLELVRWEHAYYDDHAQWYRNYLDLLTGAADGPESFRITDRIGLVRRE